jgi:cytochrome d ubiquinol oxidase subunit I
MNDFFFAPSQMGMSLAFQIIFAIIGMAMPLLMAVAEGWRNRRLPDNKWLLRRLVCCAPLGSIAVGTGWFVTELGRQPWIIYGFMRTSDAVTPKTERANRGA